MAVQKQYGVIVPLISPFIRKDEQFIIDQKATFSLLSQLIDNRAGAIFLFGNAGGCTKILDTNQRRKHLENVVSYIKGRIPVFVGVSHDDTSSISELATHAEEHGVEAIVLMLNQGRASYDEKVSAALKATYKIPLFLYNNPFVGQKRNLSAEEFRRLFQLYPGRIVGLKESSGDEILFSSFVSLQKELPFLLFMGDAMKISWIVKNQNDMNFSLPGAVPVEANLPDRVILYQQLLQGENPKGIEYLSVPQVLKILEKDNLISPATLEFWNS